MLTIYAIRSTESMNGEWPRDLTNDAKHLKAMATEAGEEMFVLPEHAARFDTALNPDYGKAIAIVRPDGITIL